MMIFAGSFALYEGRAIPSWAGSNGHSDVPYLVSDTWIRGIRIGRMRGGCGELLGGSPFAGCVVIVCTAAGGIALQIPVALDPERACVRVGRMVVVDGGNIRISD
ncbi:hypothetical protein FDG2_2540 [Candidatus Protofrankia californiensis]|uniref:Uncharacterized protein n=1 Tax=Candidatus Protofrankia californiensis TaxID=1839754 RepID=A0A1C3NXY0_9ACTN|nr:hypothetical protein FDG2_2540 [Candidatus Protofrankia californiensis]